MNKPSISPVSALPLGSTSCSLISLWIADPLLPPISVLLAGRPESKPLLGIRPWSQTAPSAQLDIKLTLDLREGRPATDERLECQVSVEGQHVRLRWAGSGAVGRMRVYELKIERWEARADKPKKVHSLKRTSLRQPPHLRLTDPEFLLTHPLGSLYRPVRQADAR